MKNSRFTFHTLPFRIIIWHGNNCTGLVPACVGHARLNDTVGVTVKYILELLSVNGSLGGLPATYHAIPSNKILKLRGITSIISTNSYSSHICKEYQALTLRADRTHIIHTYFP